MFFEVSIIEKKEKKKDIYVCPQTPTTLGVAFQRSNKWAAAGPFAGCGVRDK